MSTSPSYLTLASLDLCNQALAGEEPERIRTAAGRLAAVKRELSVWGWALAGDEPLKLTINAAACGWNGLDLADILRTGGVEPEYTDQDHVVLMASGATDEEAFQFIADALRSVSPKPRGPRPVLPLARGERVLSVRGALFAPQETVSVEQALGRVCGAPAVSCPPAIPIAVSGEVIGPEALALFCHYGIGTVDVLL